jgi:hypothetical protein
MPALCAALLVGMPALCAQRGGAQRGQTPGPEEGAARRKETEKTSKETEKTSGSRHHVVGFRLRVLSCIFFLQQQDIEAFVLQHFGVGFGAC